MSKHPHSNVKKRPLVSFKASSKDKAMEKLFIAEQSTDIEDSQINTPLPTEDTVNRSACCKCDAVILVFNDMDFTDVCFNCYSKYYRKQTPIAQ